VARFRRRIYQFAKGPFSEWRNGRVSRDPEALLALERRGGLRRIARVTSAAVATDLASASSHYISVPYDARVWALGTRFSIEGLVNADSLGATHYVLGRKNATPGVTIHYTSANGGSLIADVWDSGATQTTVTKTGVGAAGTLLAFRFTRNGSALSLVVNDASAATGTMSATLALRASTDDVLFGANGAGPSDFFDGKVDFLDLFSSVRTGASRYSRLVNPMAESVLASYAFERDGNGYLLDKSRFENHGTYENSAASGATALCDNHAPIQAIAPNRDRQGVRRVFVVANGRVLPGTVV
jgi:hypothetical protein